MTAHGHVARWNAPARRDALGFPWLRKVGRLWIFVTCHSSRPSTTSCGVLRTGIKTDVKAWGATEGGSEARGYELKSAGYAPEPVGDVLEPVRVSRKR